MDQDGAAGNGSEAAAMRAGLPSPAQTAIGFVTNFFDTLGIGSYATTTSIYKLFRLVPDRLIQAPCSSDTCGRPWPRR